MQKAILQALREGDFMAVIDIYRAHLRVLNRTHAAKAPNMPSLRTFTAFMKALGAAAR